MRLDHLLVRMQEDWDRVRDLCEHHPKMLPNFGLHPWYLGRRSPTWLEELRSRLEEVPGAAVGEVRLYDFERKLQEFLVCFVFTE